MLFRVILYYIILYYIILYYIILYAPAFLSYYEYWPDDGLVRPKLVANI